MGLAGVLNIAKTALQATQSAIQTTSHNIANVNTPGYTRQRVEFSAGLPILGGGIYIGTGVTADNVERVYDRFLGLQIHDANESMGKFSALSSSLSRLEGIFNDQEGLGLGDVLNEFFSALQDVANDPSDYSARSVLLSKAGTLTDRVNDIDSRIRSEINSIENQLKGEADDINSIASQIANLNDRIQQAEGGGREANDLRDERDILINELAEKIDITYVEDTDGMVTIMAGGGTALVAGKDTASLSVSGNSDNNNYYDIYIGSHNITSSISGGSVKGLLDARDSYYQDSLSRLNTFAASLTKEFNVLHTQGYGLDSSTGLDFFSSLSPSVTPKGTNTGGATSSVSVQTLSSLTLDDYEIQFTSASSFNIVNTTENTVVSSGNTYTSGANIDFDGLRVVITDGSSTPNAGDVFKVSVTKDEAKNFSVSLTDPNKFAAAQDSGELPGDNSNALSMIDLQGSKVLSNGQATFDGFYSSLVSDIGVASSESAANEDSQSYVLEELEMYRQSVSGVSLDEEGVNLLKYQHAYEAAGKVMTIVDEMFDTLIGLK